MRKEFDFDLRVAILEEIVKGTEVTEVASQFNIHPEVVRRVRREARARGALGPSLDILKLIDRTHDSELEKTLFTIFEKLRSADVITVPRTLFEQTIADTQIHHLLNVLVQATFECACDILREGDRVAVGYGAVKIADALKSKFSNVQVVRLTNPQVQFLSNETRKNVVITELPPEGRKFRQQDLELMQHAGVVVGMSGGINRALSINRILSAGMVTHLVTDTHTARELIDLRRS